MNKGLIYTSFAILASAVILLVASIPVNSTLNLGTGEATRIGEASFFLDSVLKDTDRSLRIASRRALTGSTDYVVETGSELVNPSKNISEAVVNGTISGRQLNSTENASLRDWKHRVSNVSDRSGYSLRLEISDYSFNSSDFSVDASYTVFARLQDPVTLASFNRTRKANTTASVEGLEDTMLLLRSKGRYISQYEKCSFDDPAEVLMTGSRASSGTAHGKAVLQPSDATAVSDKAEKILVTSDIDSESDVESFSGVVSDDINDSDYSVKHVSGTGTLSGIEDNMSLILHEDDVWRSSFREMFRENCYVETPRGPGFFDRLENELVSPGDEEGLATMIQVTELPQELRKTESAVGYAYFNETGYGDLNEIDGVTSEYSWFRLDDHHVDLWNLDSLAD